MNNEVKRNYNISRIIVLLFLIEAVVSYVMINVENNKPHDVGKEVGIFIFTLFPICFGIIIFGCATIATKVFAKNKIRKLGYRFFMCIANLFIFMVGVFLADFLSGIMIIGIVGIIIIFLSIYGFVLTFKAGSEKDN